MMQKTFFACLLVLAVTTVAEGQVKVSGSLECGKPTAQHALEVGDRPGHSLAVSQSKCTWTKPFEIAGTQSKEGVATAADEIRGNSIRSRGYFVDTMANGDQVHYRYQCTTALQDGAPQSAACKWTLVGGTGKLKGIKGTGSCTGKARADGGFSQECEGDYTLPK